MNRTFDEYSQQLTHSLEGLGDRQKFFFVVWCCHHLYITYAKHIPTVLSQSDYDLVRDMMQFLLERIDDFDTFNNEEKVYDMVEAIRGIGPEDQLDAAEVIDSGINNLLGIIEDAATFLLQRDDELIATGSENIVVVIDVIMSFELGMDTRDIDKHFDHPLMKEELDRQFQLLEYLQSEAQPGRQDIRIFRQ